MNLNIEQTRSFLLPLSLIVLTVKFLWKAGESSSWRFSLVWKFTYLKERNQLSYHGSHHSGIGGSLSIESKGTRTPVHDDDVVVSLLQELAGHVLKHARTSCDIYVMHNAIHSLYNTNLSLLVQHNSGFRLPISRAASANQNATINVLCEKKRGIVGAMFAPQAKTAVERKTGRFRTDSSKRAVAWCMFIEELVS